MLDIKYNMHSFFFSTIYKIITYILSAVIEESLILFLEVLVFPITTTVYATL